MKKEFKNFLDEITKREKGKINFHPTRTAIEKFNIDGNEYDFIAQIYNIGVDEVLSVEFKLKGGKLNGTALEGGKKSFLVFSKVANFIQDICDDISPTYINFQARENKRQKIYNKLFNYIKHKNNFPYSMMKNNPITGDEIDESDFWLERIK